MDSKGDSMNWDRIAKVLCIIGGLNLLAAILVLIFYTG